MKSYKTVFSLKSALRDDVGYSRKTSQIIIKQEKIATPVLKKKFNNIINISDPVIISMTSILG